MNVTKINKIGDPQIILYNGKYYCYVTNCDHFSAGFDVWESDDMINWDGPFMCFEAIKYWGESHFWAPEVVYHNGKFVMHYTAKSKELNSLRMGVAVSDNPKGPFVDVHNAPMFDFGYATIDGSVLVCEQGNFMYYSKDCSENFIDDIRTSQVYCVRLNDDLTKTVGEPMLMTTPTYEWERKSINMKVPFLWNEGPTVIKVGDKFVMNYSANYYASNDYAICVATASNPLGPWEKSINNPVLSCNKELFGAGHNAFFRGKDGNMYTSFHIQTNPLQPSGDRTTVIGKVTFSEKNGDILQTIE